MIGWQIGDVRLTRVQEMELPGLSFVLPDAVPKNLTAIPWLSPHFIDGAGEAMASIHALLVESGGRRIIVDTCVGNDKRRGIPAWNDRQGPFLDDLEAAGAAAESVDLVVCTHLHVDHVGWNTRLVEGRWVPTFPNARYLVPRREWEHWSKVGGDRFEAAAIADSVRPVFDAGLVDLVATDHRIDESLCLEPTPGHTPGHVSVRIDSRGESGIVTGDLIHHPCQMARPEWGSNFDTDPGQARQTRLRFLETHADTSTLVVGTHFAGPTAGRVRRDGKAYRFEV